MLLSGAMWSWRGCVQGSGSMSKYRNQLKISQKISQNIMSPYKFISKTYSSLLPWYWGGCVDGLGSIPKYRTMPQKWLKHQKTMRKNANNIPCYHNVAGAVFRVQGPYPNIENVVSLWNVVVSPD